MHAGIETLIGARRHWLAGQRVAVLSHQAAVARNGATTAQALRAAGVDVRCILGPEHGYFGAADAGERTRGEKDPETGLPVHSLYGAHRQPSASMLRDIDLIVHDLQDLGVRAYTYLATMQLAMQAAADRDIGYVVADRPVPLPRVVDGPVTDADFASFVAPVHVPLVYGMTPGETAQWLRSEFEMDLDLRVAPLRGYTRDASLQDGPHPWIPPSPGIVSWETAALYPLTVFTEAIPHLDCGRASGLSFQLLGAPWLDGVWLAEAVNAAKIRGLQAWPHRYVPRSGHYAGRRLDGVRLVLTHASRFRPAAATVRILSLLQERYGRRRIWSRPGVRRDWFDKLLGTDQPRQALEEGAAADDIIAAWQAGLRRYRASRKPHLLYPDRRPPT